MARQLHAKVVRLRSSATREPHPRGLRDSPQPDLGPEEVGERGSGVPPADRPSAAEGTGLMPASHSISRRARFVAVIAGLLGPMALWIPIGLAQDTAGRLGDTRYYSTAAPPADYPGPSPILLAMVDPTESTSAALDASSRRSLPVAP